jgi:hypothetical protein
MARLKAGAKIALVSDAGTPHADPGVALVRACWQNSVPVDPVPGASLRSRQPWHPGSNWSRSPFMGLPWLGRPREGNGLEQLQPIN